MLSRDTQKAARELEALMKPAISWNNSGLENGLPFHALQVT